MVARHFHFGTFDAAPSRGVHAITYTRVRKTGATSLLALGSYPDVCLKEARVAADTARGHLRNGIDPGQLRKIQKSVRLGAAANTFQTVALEWFTKQKPTWAENHWTKV